MVVPATEHDGTAQDHNAHESPRRYLLEAELPHMPHSMASHNGVASHTAWYAARRNANLLLLLGRAPCILSGRRSLPLQR